MRSLSGSLDFYTLSVDERTIHMTCFKDSALVHSNNTSIHGLGPCILFPLSFTISITGTLSASSPYVTENLFEILISKKNLVFFGKVLQEFKSDFERS